MVWSFIEGTNNFNGEKFYNLEIIGTLRKKIRSYKIGIVTTKKDLTFLLYLIRLTVNSPKLKTLNSCCGLHFLELMLGDNEMLHTGLLACLHF